MNSKISFTFIFHNSSNSFKIKLFKSKGIKVSFQENQKKVHTLELLNNE